MRRWTVLGFCAAILIGLAAPSAAPAASVYGGTTVFIFEARPGEANRVTITRRNTAAYAVLVTDVYPIAVPRQEGSGGRQVGCSHPAGNIRRAVCVITSEDEPRFSVDLGDRSDTLRLMSAPVTPSVEGGTGNDLIVAIQKDTGGGHFGLGAGHDTFRGGADTDIVLGEAGNDLIFGYGGNDLLLGLAGNDTIYGGLGNDCLGGGSGFNRLFGGPGVDRLNCKYGDSPEPPPA